MEVIKLGENFVALNSFAHKDILKKSGWVWNKIVKGEWATRNWFVAIRFIAFSIDDTRPILEAAKKKLDRNYILSYLRRGDYEGYPKHLLPYQVSAIEYMKNLHGKILLADEMGLGKTIMAICAADLLHRSNEFPKVLVVCPSYLATNWKREIDRWSDYKWNVIILRNNFGEIKHLCGSCIFIISYGMLEKYSGPLKKRLWDMIIGDEAHYIKNAGTKRSKNFMKLVSPSRMLLTGTPMVNDSPKEIYNLMRWVNPSIWNDSLWFLRRFEGVKAGKGGWNKGSPQYLNELNYYLRGTGMIRRLKKDVLPDLPAKIYKVVEYPVPENAAGRINEENTMYEAIEKSLAELRVSIAEAKAGGIEEAYKEAVMELNQFAMRSRGRMATIRKDLSLVKASTLIGYIKEDVLPQDRKLVVFSYHKQAARMISEAFGIYAVWINGDVPVAERMDLVDAFQNKDEIRLISGTYGAMGTGVTLTAASHVILTEPDWVPAVMNQAIDRLHRIGQHDSVLAEYFVFEGSLDCYIAQRAVRKQNVIEEALGEKKDSGDNNLNIFEDDSRVSILTREQLTSLSETTLPQKEMMEQLLEILDLKKLSSVDRRIVEQVLSQHEITKSTKGIAMGLINAYRNKEHSTY